MIKFKVYDKILNCYSNFDMYIGMDGTLYENEGNEMVASQEDRYIIQLSTGKRDVEGTEIFDGDIVTSDEYPFQREGEYNYHGIIGWDDYDMIFYVVLKAVNPKIAGISDGIGEELSLYHTDRFKIIGNMLNNNIFKETDK